MTTNMDIDMDLDVAFTEDLTVQEHEAMPDVKLSSDESHVNPIVKTPNDTSEENFLEPLPHKVHLRGLDNLRTDDIKAFALEYFDSYPPSHIEWIDDTSANLVYESQAIAREALLAFSATTVTDISQLPNLQTIRAKAFPLHPQTNLEVRIAVVGDRKKAGARERSRFYLLNPEYDTTECRRQIGTRGAKKYRDREDGGYRSQKYDDHEQRKRERDVEFDASLYDENEIVRKKQAGAYGRRRCKSSSGIESRDRESWKSGFRGAAGKELFPDRRDTDSGRLRDRSASPPPNSGDEGTGNGRIEERKMQVLEASANRLKAQMIKEELRNRVGKELFPEKTSRSGIFHAKDETDNKVAPFTDGSSNVLSRSTGSSVSRVTNMASQETPGFSIRGLAKSSTIAQQKFSIKGAASNFRVKELFPTSVGNSSTKELFSERLRTRGQPRQKAEDLFS